MDGLQEKLAGISSSKELKKILTDSKEGENLEFKEKNSHLTASEVLNIMKTGFENNILKSIYGLANTEGGSLIIGIEDKTKEIVGISDKEKREIAGIINQVKLKIKKIRSDIKIFEKTIDLKNKRTVEIIFVRKKETIFGNPLMLNGKIYFRKNSFTEPIQNLGDFYEKEKEYKFYLKGIENYLKNLKGKNINSIKLYIEGLKESVSSEFMNNEDLNKVFINLDKIKNLLIKKEEKNIESNPEITSSYTDMDIDNEIITFVKTLGKCDVK